MNLKKYIKFKESPQEDKLTPEEEERFNALVSRIESNAAGSKTVRRANLWRILTPIVSVMGAIAIILTCVFTIRSGDFKYNYDNIKSDKTTFTEMQEDINYFDITYIEDFAEQTTKYYDMESNHNLYYSMYANLELSKIELVVVINEKYDYKFELEQAESKQLTDYTLTYSSVASRNDPQITYRGWIKVQTETVYFEYVQVPASGDEAFFESIQQIIKLK